MTALFGQGLGDQFLSMEKWPTERETCTGTAGHVKTNCAKQTRLARWGGMGISVRH
jgi:hypothetical protein